mmetsp:Transcript_39959/g.43320  ORF Transcript_39959/g.43320 Transcript_39959/m.43320 type:complete len:511 (-) Transcript_39959:39-1571(-)
MISTTMVMASSEQQEDVVVATSNRTLTTSFNLGVDDRTRHWHYDTSIPRQDNEIENSIHQNDDGGTTVDVTVRVYDGRSNKSLTLDTAAFEFVDDCCTKLSRQDFYDLQEGDAAKAIQYNKEIETYVAKKLNCDTVICVQSQVRNSNRAGKNGVQDYAGGAPHTDSSSVSSDIFVLNTLKGNNLKGSDYKRYCYLNLWRNINDEHPIQNNHLALLDERTVAKPDDYLPLDVIGDGYYEVTQYRLNARHANHHKWYYFPNLRKHEAILFKQMDSDSTKSGRICFHMSVDDPTAKNDDGIIETETETIPSRESIEVRMICLWKKSDRDSMPTNENVHRDLVRSPKEYAIELKQRQPHTDLDSASLTQLIHAMVCRLPLVGNLFKRFLMCTVSGLSIPVDNDIINDSKKNNRGIASPKYSGTAADYLDQFVQNIDSFPTWHASSQAWAQIQMKRHDSACDGIEGITRTLVEDQLGFLGTKTFLQNQKDEIVSFLLKSIEYTEACKRHLSPLLD